MRVITKKSCIIINTNIPFFFLICNSQNLWGVFFFFFCILCKCQPVLTQSLVLRIIDNFQDCLCYAKSLQSYPTLCDPIDSSPPGSPIPGILQARTLELVAISFSNAWKWKVKGKSLSRVWLLATPWTAAYQALPSMGFSRQEYWSGVPLPSLSRLPTKKQIANNNNKKISKNKKLLCP